MDDIIQQIYRKHRKNNNHPEEYINRSMVRNNNDSSTRHQKRYNQYLCDLQKKSLDLDDRRPAIKAYPRMMNNQTSLYIQQTQKRKQSRLDYNEVEKQLMLPLIKTRRTYKNSSRNSSTRGRNTSKYSLSSLRRPIKEKKKQPKNPIRLQNTRKKFIKCLQAVIFIKRLQKLWILKKQRIQLVTNLSNDLLNGISKLIKKHYSEILLQQFMEFGSILKSHIIRPETDLTHKIIGNLVDFTGKLKETNIRKDLLTFLALVTLQNNPLPNDFLTEFEILRLNFHTTRFQLINMNETKVKMIVGIFMAIKVCCGYIFKQPWQIDVIGVTEASQEKIQAILWAYTSYINCAVLTYFKKMDKQDNSLLKRLRQKGVKPIKNKKIQDQFFNRVCLNYRKSFHKINSNLIVWINRITSQVIKWQANYQ